MPGYDDAIRGDVAEVREISYEQFCERIYDLSGFELPAYKRNQIERRIRAYAQRKGAPTLLALWERLSSQPQGLQQFIDYLTVNVTYFFRDPERFQELRDIILPELLSHQRELFIWSAGCANGSEAYSVNMLLHQLDSNRKHAILATDIHEASVARARRGLFSMQDLQQIPPAFREQYFTPAGNEYRIDQRLRQGIEFQCHDLLCDPYPLQVDLILCRNVYIYLTRPAQHRVFMNFHAALRPGGYLLVGNSERMLEAGKAGFTSPLPHFYQKTS